MLINRLLKSAFVLVSRIVQSTSAISNTCYLELLLCRTFYLVPSALSLTSLINPFGISNSATTNCHYVEQFSRSPQSYKGCFPSAISNIRMRFSNESYCLFQNFVEKFVLSFFNIVQAATCPQLSENSEKSLGEKWQALRYLEKSLSKKTPLKNMVYPETPFQLGLKTIKYFAALEQSWNKRKKN